MEFSFQAILFLVGFLCACFFVIFPKTIRFKSGKSYILDYSNIPIAVVLLLFVTQTIPWVIIVRGLLGVNSPEWAKDPTNSSFLVPYTVIILFMTLAYVCMSAEYTKVFVFIANKFSRIALSSSNPSIIGLSLFSLLSGIFTLTTSNDIVVLTLTPIILQFSRKTDKRLLLSLLLAEFCAANSFSAGLLSGNPSNFILGSVFSIDFMEYLQHLLLPAILSGCCVFVYCVIMANRACATKKEGKEEKGMEIEIPIIVTNDTITKVDNEKGGKLNGNAELPPAVISVPPRQIEGNPKKEEEIPLTPNALIALIILIALFILFLLSSAIQEKWPSIQLWHIAVLMFAVTFIKDVIFYRKQYNSIWAIVKSLPWTVPLFLLAMFILVESASYYHYTTFIADAIAKYIVVPTVKGGDFWVAVVFNVITCLACIIFNNLPATIFITRVISEKSMKTALGDEFAIAVYSVAAGTNFGACILPHCSLAGLMWSKLVKNDELLKKVWKHGTLICVIMIIVCSLMLTFML